MKEKPDECERRTRGRNERVNDEGRKGFKVRRSGMMESKLNKNTDTQARCFFIGSPSRWREIHFDRLKVFYSLYTRVDDLIHSLASY